MLDCKMCGVTLYTCHICEDCSAIKKLYDIYSKEVVLNALQQLFTRNKEQLEHKQKHIKLKDREK